MKTRTQLKALARAMTKELDSNTVDDLEIEQWINYGQLRVQNEFAKINFKYFTKSIVNTGATFTEPSDLLQYPNSIINLLASTGTRASKTITYATPTGNLIHTFKEAGTGGNAINISCDGATYVTPSAGTVSCLLVGGVFYMEFASGALTGSQIVALFNADPIYSQYFTCSTAYPSAVIVPSVGTSGLLTGGTGANYVPASEVSSENFVRIEDNPYKAPSATNPKYRRMGNANGKLIEVLPQTVTYSQLEYYYRLPDLTADSDTLKVPAELEEVVLLDVMKRIYEKVEKKIEAEKMEAEYKAKFDDYVKGYLDKRQSETAEKTRNQSSDINN